VGLGLLREAQQLGDRGFRVHPLKAKDQPYTKYSETASSDPTDIERLWRRFPDALIGICTGDGLVVVDDDRGLAFPDSSMPLTLVARTANRGFHHYFYCTTPVRNSASKIAPNIDVRGQGGYVVAPPSAGYEWFDVWQGSEHPIANLPGVLLAACLRSEPKGGDFEPRSHVAAGERHDYLVRFAGWALANELADDLGVLHAITFEHAMDVCDPWPGPEQAGVYRHVGDICRWVIARESGER
jgi:hypothetical protein